MAVLHAGEVPDQPRDRVRPRICPECQHLDARVFERGVNNSVDSAEGLTPEFGRHVFPSEARAACKRGFKSLTVPYYDLISTGCLDEWGCSTRIVACPGRHVLSADPRILHDSG